MLEIVRKIMEKVGFMLIANSVLFTPIIASADSGGNGFLGAVIGGALGGAITGGVLVSMSRSKFVATRAEKYVDGDLKLEQQLDQFVRTETDRKKVSS